MDLHTHKQDLQKLSYKFCPAKILELQFSSLWSLFKRTFLDPSDKRKIFAHHCHCSHV